MSKLFLKKTTINLNFKKYRKYATNILKSPCRHKKFFHKVVYEYFVVSITYRFLEKKLFSKKFNILKLFRKLNKFYDFIGTNSLTRTKFLIFFPVQLIANFVC